MTRTIVVGLGRSGLGAARLLKQQNRDVIVFERGDNEVLQYTSKTLAEEGIEVSPRAAPGPGELSTPGEDNLGAVVIGPGIPWDHPTLVQLRSDGRPGAQRNGSGLGCPSADPLDRHHRKQRQNHGHTSAQPRAGSLRPHGTDGGKHGPLRGRAGLPDWLRLPHPHRIGSSWN